MLSGQIDVGLPLCIEPSGALLDVVLSALYGWHQHWGGGCIGRANWAPTGTP